MIHEVANRYPNVFRTARFIPAVEYLTACRFAWTCSRLFQLSRYDIIIAQYVKNLWR
jgi:hypothetical protein